MKSANVHAAFAVLLMVSGAAIAGSSPRFSIQNETFCRDASEPIGDKCSDGSLVLRRVVVRPAKEWSPDMSRNLRQCDEYGTRGRCVAFTTMTAYMDENGFEHDLIEHFSNGKLKIETSDGQDLSVDRPVAPEHRPDLFGRLPQETW
jgi:hypothetical protein